MGRTKEARNFILWVGFSLFPNLIGHLSILKLHIFNQTLLRKSLWHYATKRDAFWGKFGVMESHWHLEKVWGVHEARKHIHEPRTRHNTDTTRSDNGSGRIGFGVEPSPYPTGSGEWTIDPLSTKCSGQSRWFGSLIEQVEIVKWFLVWSTTQKNQRTQQQSKDPWDWNDEVKSNCTRTTNPKIYETKTKRTERQREERQKIKLQRDRSTCERRETTTVQR